MKRFAIVVGALFSLASCVCDPNEVTCGNRCVDVLSDESNCGACGRPCFGTCVAGMCLPGAACDGDADCDDGLVCNGSERCAGGACTSRGDTMSCDDGLACTRDRCVEPGRCEHDRDDAWCGPDATCSASTGDGCESQCDEDPCRIVEPQCGCGAGEACYPAAVGTGCSPAGWLAVGASCSRDEDCGVGLVCVELSTSGGARACVETCIATPDCSGSAFCNYPLTDDTGALLDAATCTLECDLRTGFGCVPGTKCILLGDSSTGLFATDCVGPPGRGVAGDACTAEQDCASGYLCVTFTDARACGAYCRVGFSDCGGGSCAGFRDRIVVQGTEYGVCVR